MASTSINIQPCNISSSEQHNQRLKTLDYVRSELTYLNESWYSDSKSLSQHLAEIERAYKQAKGKRMHAKATPIREGVIVLQESTTIDDLHHFASACQERWGIVPLQIHIHRDEGHMHSKEWKKNLHAHIIWDWTDEHGVTRKLNKYDMIEMQTLLAETLKMERGISSDKKHLSSLQFKNKAEEEKLAETHHKIQEAKEELGDIQILQEEIENAVKAEIKPIDAILENNTSKGLLWGKKVDYEAVIDEIRKQERDKTTTKVVGKRREELQINKLKDELAKVKGEYEQYVDTITQIVGDGFKKFLEDLKRWTERVFSNIEKIKMWNGEGFRDKRKGYIYSADKKNSKLLINGKTIDEVQEERKRKMKQRKSLQEERLSPRRGFRR